jgi:hypothetical protein
VFQRFFQASFVADQLFSALQSGIETRACTHLRGNVSHGDAAQ